MISAWILIASFMIVVVSGSSSTSEQQKLLESKFREYDRRVRPSKNGEPTLVYVQPQLIAISDVVSVALI